jgi:hypothetical protein
MEQSQARAFVSLVGIAGWLKRMGHVRDRVSAGAQSGRLAAQKFAAECAIEKARRGQPLVPAETALVELATRLPNLYETLNASGQTRLRERLAEAMDGAATVMPLLHVMHTASLQEARGFEVAFTALEQATPFDLLISRDGAQAEVACDTLSAEAGHAVPRSCWTQLIDQVDPDLQTWLAAHPGRYLLKMTLPKGLKGSAAENLPALYGRIKTMLAEAKRADYDEAAILRLDPLLLAGAQAGDSRPGMVANLRREFGPEAHFSVTEAGGSLFVLAARGAEENQVAKAMRARLSAIAPARLSGARPGILAMFLDDTDQPEWKRLREQLLLEGETRHFLTFPEARTVIAVTCASRFELAKAGVPGGDVRFRNPMHPAAKNVALAPAVVSTM